MDPGATSPCSPPASAFGVLCIVVGLYRLFWGDEASNFVPMILILQLILQDPSYCGWILCDHVLILICLGEFGGLAADVIQGLSPIDWPDVIAGSPGDEDQSFGVSRHRNMVSFMYWRWRMCWFKSSGRTKPFIKQSPHHLCLLGPLRRVLLQLRDCVLLSWHDILTKTRRKGSICWLLRNRSFSHKRHFFSVVHIFLIQSETSAPELPVESRTWPVAAAY